MSNLKHKHWQKGLKVLYLNDFKSSKARKNLSNSDWFSIIIVVSGTINFMASNADVSLSKGDMFSLPADVEVSKMSPSLQVCFLCCKKDLAIISRFSKSGEGYIKFLNNCPTSVISLHEADLNFMIQLFGFLKKKISTQETFFQQEMTLLYVNLILYEFSALCLRYSEKSSHTALSTEKISSRFMLLVQQHCRIHHTVNFYADSLFVSKGHLGKAVRNAIGMSAKHYIEMAVIAEAYALLADEKLTITQIGEDLSFRDASSFSHFFKRHTKLTPTQYRFNLNQ